MQQNTKNTGHARAGRTKADNRGIQRTARTADRRGNKRTDKAQVDTEDGRLGNTHERGKRCGQRHRLELLVLGFERNCESRTALCDISRRCQRQPIGQAVGTELSKVDDGVHVMDAGNNGGCVQPAHDERTNAKRNGNQPLHAVDDKVLDRCEHRTDGRQR